MDLINDSQTYLSGSEIIKYIAIAVCGILVIQVLFVQDKLSTIQMCIIGALMYFILKYDFKKRKMMKQNSQK